MNESKYEVIVYWDKVDTIFVAEVPELPGCMAHGESKAMAMQNAEDAIELWLISVDLCPSVCICG